MANGEYAYDLSLFETKKANLVALKPNKKEIKRNSRRDKLQRVLNVSAIVLIALAVIAVIGMRITVGVQLTEVNARISQAEARLSELQSEQVRLESELASKTSIAHVNEYAQENGMTLSGSNQINYITVSGTDTVTVADNNAGFFAAIWNGILQIFS